MKKFILVLGLLLLPSLTVAGEAKGKITQVLAHTYGGNGAGVFMFVLDGVRSNIPDCSTIAGGKAWAMSLENESGRAMYALALTAYSQGKIVYVHGDGTCSSWGDRENPVYMNIINQ
jgi:hypothetical protein